MLAHGLQTACWGRKVMAAVVLKDVNLDKRLYLMITVLQNQSNQ